MNSCLRLDFVDDNASAAAKQHAKEILEAAGYSVRAPETTDDEHQTRVLAGYKAALHSELPSFLFNVEHVN